LADGRAVGRATDRAVEPIVLMCRLLSRTPEAVTICPERHTTSARSGPAGSDISKVLIVQASFV
jgi:hypothetical protein